MVVTIYNSAGFKELLKCEYLLRCLAVFWANSCMGRPWCRIRTPLMWVGRISWRYSCANRRHTAKKINVWNLCLNGPEWMWLSQHGIAKEIDEVPIETDGSCVYVFAPQIDPPPRRSRLLTSVFKFPYTCLWLSTVADSPPANVAFSRFSSWHMSLGEIGFY